MSIEVELQGYIMEEIVPNTEGNAIVADELLLDSGRVDSMGLLNILGFVQQKFGVDLLAKGGPSDFESINAIAAAIRRAQGG